MSIKNAKIGYSNGTLIQLCYILAILVQPIAHYRFRLDPLTSQSLLVRIRVSSSSLL